MYIRYAGLTEMEDQGLEDNAIMAASHTFDKMLQLADVSASDHVFDHV